MAFKFKVPFTVHENEIEDASDPNGDISSIPQVDAPQVQAPQVQQSQTPQIPGVQTSPVQSPTPQVSGASGINIPPINPELFNRLKTAIENPPLLSNNPPSTKRRVAAGLIGAGAGITGGPKAGIETATEIRNQPYNQAYQDYLTRTGALEKGIGLQSAQRTAETRGLVGLASATRAVNAANPELQGAIAGAKADAQEEAKTQSTPLIRNYKYWSGQPENSNKTFEDYLNEIKTSNGGMERISGQMVTADDARLLNQTQGTVFKDRAGNVINIAELPSNMGLSLISGGKSGSQVYEVATQPTRNVTQGNITNVVPSRSPTVALTSGVARVPVTRQEPGVDAQGNPAPQSLTTTPSTPGPFPNPVVKPPVSSIPQSQGQPQVQPPQIPGQIPGQVQSKVPIPQTQNNGAKGTSFNNAVFQPAEIKRQTDKAALLATSFSQLFGSTKYPDAPSLKTYSKLADNPESREKIGTVLNMILDNMTTGEGGESVGANALGFGASASLGGLFTWLKNATGTTEGIAKGKVSAINNALSKLSPEENDYVNQLFAAYGSIGGMRQSLGMPAYRWAFDSLKREVPGIGTGDVRDSRTYNNKLAKIGVEGMENIDHAGISRQFLPEYDFWDKNTKDLIKAGSSSQTKKPKYEVEEVTK